MAQIFCRKLQIFAETRLSHVVCPFYHWETKGRFRKRVVLANVPSFRFSFQGNMRTYLVPVFVPGEHPNVPSFRFSFRGNIRQNHTFGNHPFSTLDLFFVTSLHCLTLLRTRSENPSQNPFSCKTHIRPPSQNPSPEPFPEPSENPSQNAVLPHDPLPKGPSHTKNTTG